MKTEIFTDSKTKQQFLRIEIALEDPRPSKSGKTLTVATSEGCKKTGQKIDGKEIIVGVNAFIR